jgi:hypothetical protein
MSESAFPRDDKYDDGNLCFQERGITIRDYFAAAALTGNLARYGFTPSYAAKEAYEFADAMMETR